MVSLNPGDRIRIAPLDEEAEVFEVRQVGNQVILGVIFYPSQKAQRLVLSLDELPQRVQKLPTLWESFRESALMRDAFLLFVEALRMRLAYTFDPHYAVSVTQVDLLPHQVDAVYRHILPMPRIRFLLADDPGLGKTIMAGLVMKELKVRGLVKRTLLIVPAHLQDQWQREMMDWFREDFVVLRRELLSNLYAADFFERNSQVWSRLISPERKMFVNSSPANDGTWSSWTKPTNCRRLVTVKKFTRPSVTNWAKPSRRKPPTCFS